MELLLILTYTAICVGIFKLFRLPLNKWTVPTAILGGVVIIGLLLVLMNFNHPYSEVARQYVPTTPVIPEVSGHVIDVPVTSNAWLKKGDVLFQIDPLPFEARVRSLEGQKKSAQAEFKRLSSLLKKGAASRSDVDLAQAKVHNLEGDLEIAKFELRESTVRAPTDGYVTQLLLYPGMRVTKFPTYPTMVFVHGHDAVFIAWFRQNNIQRIEPGQEADLALDGLPGKVLSAQVVGTIPILAEGQLRPSGNLLTIQAGVQVPGRVPVALKITDPRYDALRQHIPGGAYGQAAIYSEHAHHVAIMRKILLRMAAWMNFVFPFH